jgi:hypothetical protein
LISVVVNGAGTAFTVGVPVPLFKTNLSAGPGVPYDMTSDGTRFIVNTRLPSRLPPSINVIVNWTELLPRRPQP